MPNTNDLELPKTDDSVDSGPPTRRPVRRRWVRYEAPIMVCVEIDEAGYDGEVVNVVLADQHDDIGLARDFRGHFLVYDNAMQRIETDEPTEGRAITIAEYRDWPDRLAWDQGPDVLRYPFLYEPDDPATNEDEDDGL